MTSENAWVLVCSEDPGLLRELLGKAGVLAGKEGWRVAALPLAAGEGAAAELGKYGVDRLYEVEGEVSGDPELGAAALSEAVAHSQASVTLVGVTKYGMEIAPRAAERTGRGYAAWAVDCTRETETGSLVAHVSRFSGIGRATYRFKPQVPVILTVPPGAFAPAETAEQLIETVKLDPGSTRPRLKVIEERPRQQGGARLEDARLVLDVGQGVETTADLDLVQTLADLLGGQLACTRPISSDRDWFPEWLGLSGKKVAPDLCLALGVSGQIQHMVGIRDSHLIAAVNKDENAAIFSQADYGVVADLKEFLPILTERIKARGVKGTWAE